MKEIILKHFGIEAIELKRLAGYENANYLVRASNESYIFKTYEFDDLLYNTVRAESDLLGHLASTGTSKYPQPLTTDSGEFVEVIEVNNSKLIIRLLTYLDGQFLAEADHTPELFSSFGDFLADMDVKLLDYKHYTIQARQFEWDLQFVHLNIQYLNDIADWKDRNIVSFFLMQFDQFVRPEIPYLRKSIIHNDANDWNVLVQKGKVSAVIDFGDCVYSPLINELAIGITYAIMEKENPLLWACHILSAYHQKLKLLEREIDLLYYLIAARLCITVCNAAHHKKLQPSNEYLSVSEKPAWNLLHKWITINPVHAKNKFRQSCNFPVVQEEPIELKIKRRHKYIDDIISISYRDPVFIKHAAFQYMYDGYGNTFLDAYNNIPHVGHSHPDIVKAGQQQMAILNTNTRYIYDLLQEYSERLLAKFPSQLNRVYFVNSGSEASDLAIRLARHYAKCENIMVMEDGYHGHTNAGIDISDYKFSNPRGPGQKSYILKAKIPDTYRGIYQDADAGQKYARNAIDQISDYGNQIAAFISEPIIGCGGQVPLPAEYLKNLYPYIRSQGGLCISDEVQTGFGRLGSHFWGFETQDVVPDIIILGKPMGNGHPIGAVVTTEKVANAFSEGVEFFSSFGGNPVSCAIGLEVLNVIDREQLQKNALEVGNYYKGEMSHLKKQFDCIGDVRGSGLFLGFEMIKEGKKHNTELAAIIKNEMRNRHVLVSTDGPKDNVIKSKPPLCFSRENVDTVVQHIYDILKKNT